MWPPPIKPVFAHSLAGEGVWKPTGPSVDGGAPLLLLTTYRPDPVYPQIVAYVAWFDHTRTALAYYPGRYQPPTAALRGPMMVSDDQRSRLLATFNGAFTHDDGNNGSADNSRTNFHRLLGPHPAWPSHGPLPKCPETLGVMSRDPTPPDLIESSARREMFLMLRATERRAQHGRLCEWLSGLRNRHRSNE
ncbi:MAG TPA: hypothetical protein VG228_03025 [Solirubrobacteraceae bacterium]|nr:hypothetical protein [Solirubrobacteraceae bacterium]